MTAKPMMMRAQTNIQSAINLSLRERLGSPTRSPHVGGHKHLDPFWFFAENTAIFNMPSRQWHSDAVRCRGVGQNRAYSSNLNATFGSLILVEIPTPQGPGPRKKPLAV